MSDSPEFELPVHGPFEVRRDFAPKQIGMAILWVVVGVGLTALMGWNSMNEIENGRFASRVWETGVDAEGQFG